MTDVRAGPVPEPVQAADPLAALVAHDPQAWQDLFEGYYRKLYNFAYVRTGDVSASEEIAAEVFAAAARGISRYRPTGAPIGAWLYRIARNITADHVDRRNKRPSISLDAANLEIETAGPNIDDATDLARSVALLTPDQQEVIALRFFNDCTLQEAAAALGKSVGAVKLLQHRALAALRRQMARDAQP